MQQPWKPAGKYEVEIRGIRNVSGVAGDTRGALTVPKAPAADSLRRAPDSLKPAPDSLKRRLPKKTP